MIVPADTPGPADGAQHEPFYDHRVPPYACPACATGVLLLKPDTLHIGEAAESRALADAVGPEIGVGQWRFVCLFECCDAGCQETVACIGEMSWTRDPRLPREPDPVTSWEPGSGPFPDVAEQRRREQAELVHEYQPRQFLPPVPAEPRRVPEGDVAVADDFTWMVVRGKRYHFKSGMQASILRVLYEAWVESGRKDGSGLSEKAIGERVGSSAERFRVQKIFEGNDAHPRILRSPSKGQWALFLGANRAQDSTAA